MNISINIKSGTGGYYDYGGCDCCIKKIEDDNFPIPRIGERIEILEDNDDGIKDRKGDICQVYHEYHVVDVSYWIGQKSYGVTIYVIPIGRSLKEMRG